MLVGKASQAQAGYSWRYGNCGAYRELCLSNPKNNPKLCEELYRGAMANGDEYRGYWNNYWTCSKK